MKRLLEIPLFSIHRGAAREVVALELHDEFLTLKSQGAKPIIIDP